MLKCKKFIDKRTGLLIGGSTLASLLIMSQPVNAQEATSPIDDVKSTVESIGGIAASAAGFVIIAMGVRLAIKQVNRVMTKG